MTLTVLGQDKWTYQFGGGVNYSLYDNDYHQNIYRIPVTGDQGDIWLGGFYKENTLGIHFEGTVSYKISEKWQVVSGLFYIQNSRRWVSTKDSVLKYSTSPNPPYIDEIFYKELQIPLKINYPIIKGLTVSGGVKFQLFYHQKVVLTRTDNSIEWSNDGLRWFKSIYYHIAISQALGDSPFSIHLAYDFNNRDPYRDYDVLLFTLKYTL